MRIRQSWPVLAVIVCALHGLSYGTAAWAGSDGQDGQTVTVHRGAAVTTTGTQDVAALSNGVVVSRGKMGVPRRGTAPVSASQQRIDRLEPIAGEELWLIDREKNRLFACLTRGTGRVGGLAIVCTKRRLPR